MSQSTKVKDYRLGLFFLFLIFLPFFSFGCELKVGVKFFPPYTIINDAGQWSGIDIDIFNLLLKEVGCEAEFIDVAFGKGLLLLKDGKIDAMAQLSKTIDRVKTIRFVGPIRLESLSLVTTVNVVETITNFEEISQLPYLFGKRAGTYIGKEFHYLYKTNKNFSSKFITLEANNPRIDMVLKNRVVGFFDESLFNKYLLKHSDSYKNMKLHPLQIDNGAVFLGFSKKAVSNELYQKLTNAHHRLKQAGKL